MNLLLVITTLLLPLYGVEESISVQEYCQLIGAIDEVRQRVPTLNKFGSNYCFNTKLTEAFLSYCKEAAKPFHVLEVGAAFGIKSAQIVQTGASLTVNDLDPRHLEIIRSTFYALSSRNSHFENASFFSGNYLNTPLGNNNFDAILIESVIHFLTPDETLQMADKLYSDLKPGGRIFLIVSSPFLRFISEVHEERKAQNDLWPGYFPDPSVVHPLYVRLHKPYHFFDKETLSKVLIEAGFSIVEARYLPLPHHEYDMGLDGREGLMIIAEKS